MKFFVTLTISLAAAVLMTGASVSGPAIYVDHDKVNQTFGKRVTGNSGQIATAPIQVVGNQRNSPGEAEVHEKQIDVFYVMDGASTIVTGGTLVGGKTVSPGQIKGTSIQGGQTYHLTKGDVMIIPAGVPHWHKEVPKSIIYYTVKVPKMPSTSGSSEAVFISHEKVTHAFGKRGPDNDGKIATSPVELVGNVRTSPGEAEIHENSSDVFYVIDGASTIVTGGKLVGAKTVSPGQVKGTSVEGGETYHLTKGDVMVIPPGVPHWHKEVPKSITYYTVKVPQQ